MNELMSVVGSIVIMAEVLKIILILKKALIFYSIKKLFSFQRSPMSRDDKSNWPFLSVFSFLERSTFCLQIKTKINYELEYKGGTQGLYEWRGRAIARTHF